MTLPVRAIIVACFAIFYAAAAAAGERQWIDGGPTPLRYDISVTPDIVAGSFAGEVRIEIDAQAPVPAVTLNAAGLAIKSATIGGSAVRVAQNDAAQTLTLTPRRPLRAGRHVIAISYDGKIQDEAYGLFRVTYEDSGVSKRMLATQFEPVDARRFAPMWDQPNRRAVFGLTVTAPTDQMAVSNMPIARAEAMPGGKTRTRFADTPAMPSYLLFLAVGDFERVTRKVGDVELGVVVRRGQTAKADYALQAGEESLRYFSDYFDIAYPLPKLDMIGVPGAGGFGAMENWGAILYFDQFLLLDPARSNERDRQRVFGIIAHEIAHQWFGNLVTMTWWDDLWLNEGFASWMAAKAVHALHPDWQPWLAQLANGGATAMALDSRAGTHPIVQRVDTIEEANLAFDPITYQKGLAIIRMIEAYVGEDDFRSGVRSYLNARKYGNAQTEDLWTAVQAASGEPVLDLARSFTGQQGFPLVTTIGGDCKATPDDQTVRITQRRFAMDAASRTAELWTIPVVAQRLGAAPTRAVIPPTASATISVPPACGAYLINAGQSAFFRVLYDEPNFAKLTAAFPTLDDADKLGLMLDYWTFARNADAPFANYLDLQAALPAGSDPILTINAVDSLMTLVEYARGRPNESRVRAYVGQRLADMFARVGWTARPGEPSNEGVLRARLIEAQGVLADPATIAEARRRIAAAAADPEALPGAIRDAALSAYARNASLAEHQALIENARKADDFVEARRLWLKAAETAEPSLAQSMLARTLGEDIPRQLRPQVIRVVAEEHPSRAWEFIVANRSAVEALLDPLQRLEYPGDIASLSADPAIAAALEAYGANFPEGAKRTIESAAATIRLRAETIERRMPEVEAWIAVKAAAARPDRRSPRTRT